MPDRCPHPCNHPGCNVLVTGRSRCPQHTTELGKVYRSARVQKFYNSPRWKTLRAEVLAAQPWCVDCLKVGKHEKSTDVHHVSPHLGDEVKFWSGPFEALCHPCHTKKDSTLRQRKVRS